MQQWSGLQRQNPYLTRRRAMRRSMAMTARCGDAAQARAAAPIMAPSPCASTMFRLQQLVVHEAESHVHCMQIMCRLHIVSKLCKQSDSSS